MRFRSAAAAVILALGMTVAAQSISIQLDGNAFRIVGWTPPASVPAGGWQSVLVVYAGVGDVPPLAGSYAVDHGSLVFHPAFPLAPGPHYRVVFHPPGGAAVERTFAGPVRAKTPAARVTQVYPSANILPSNQLRLYVYFSAPMSRGEAERHVHLLDASGHVLPGVFLPGEELWDPNDTRLTMTFDPGRIKRDLTSNRAMGPPIAEGRRYTLVIDREWRDANGQPLAETYRKIFRGGPAVRQPPDPKTWRLTAPPAGTRAPLLVDFGRPMNYALLQRTLTVAGPRGEIAGTTAVTRGESEWRFTPRDPWPAGAARLVIDNTLEDLAGNKIGQPFDIDVFDKVTPSITTTYTTLPFEIR